MTPHKQTYFYGGNEKGVTRGNCWQTALASVLDLELDDVPHFVDIDEQGGKHWWDNSVEWCAERGYELDWGFDEPQDDNYYFVCGKSPRGNFYHVVVYKNGKMVHDPHPDGTGVLTKHSYYVLRAKPSQSKD